MKRVETGFDFAEIRKKLDREDWEPGEEGQLMRSVSLGSVMALTPSGKYYQPFACGNLGDCPVCGGTGDGVQTISRRTARKWKNENARRRRLWVKRLGPPSNWPPEVMRQSDELNRRLMRIHPSCTRCGGLGSHESWDDQQWTEAMEEGLGAIGASLESSEGDSTWLLATEWKDVEEGDDAGQSDE